ncbi:major capsid protein, partial [Thioclava sp. BHET1]
MADNTAPQFAYNTVDLVQVVPNLKRAQTFLLDKFFPNQVLSDTEFVAIDVDVGKRRMAPFVSPLVEGKLVEQRRLQTNIFKPPYIKDKRAPDLRKPVRRMIGERIGGELTGQERELANIQFEMEDQVDVLTRRLEWMASQALQTGTVLVKGEGFDDTLIDFGRDPQLTITLAGNAQWGVTANFNGGGRDPVPTKSIENWQHTILKLSGAKVTDIIFTTTPWELFLNAEGVQGAIYYPKLGDQGNSINNGPQIAPGAVYKGRWGSYDLWVYNDWYVDENNVEKPMIPDGTVLMSGPDMMGTRAFAQIMDPAFNYGPMAFAPKTWLVEDPAQRLMLMQSAP